jgi:hypothetical protein
MEDQDEDFAAYPETSSFDRFRKYHLNDSQENPYLDFHGTVKIHGSNITIIFTSPESLRIQSRNRILTAENDLYSCFATLNLLPLNQLAERVVELEKEISTEAIPEDARAKCVDEAKTESSEEWPEVMIAGEWAGKGIQKGVGVCQLDKFLTIFNIRINKKWQDIRKFRSVKLPEHRIYNICDFPTCSITIDLSSSADIRRADKEMQELVNEIDKRCPLAAQLGVEGGGEGLVYTYHPPVASYSLHHFKVKGPSHQIVWKQKIAKVPSERDKKISSFVEYAVTVARLDQGMAYLEEMNIPVEDKSTGKYISWVVKDVLKEETHTLEDMGLKEKDIKAELTGYVRAGWRDRLKGAQRKDLDNHASEIIGKLHI